MSIQTPADALFPQRAESHYVARVAAIAMVSLGGVITLGAYTIQKSRETAKEEKRIEEVERRVQENPKETRAAWELARAKLERYLDRNLSQVRSIFWLTLLTMLAGFVLIGIGVYWALQHPESFRPSILTAGSGVIVNFIGGTFLVLYKSTMEQAKDYVTVLERINAVGMSVQILDTIDNSEAKLKYETIAEVAKQLLVMYSQKKVEN